MSNVSAKPALVTSAAGAVLRSINAFVTSVVACTIGARTSEGAMAALASAAVTPRFTPSSGRLGVLNVLSTTTRPVAPSRRTTSVNVPPMSTASRQSDPSAIPVFLTYRTEDVEDPRLASARIGDEFAVAVRHVLGRPVDVARSEQLPLIAPDAEVELAGDDESELLVVGVTVVGRARCRRVDAPEAEAHVVAVEDAPLHSRLHLLECVGVVRPDLRVVAHNPIPP